jgi:hypothetical protein
MQPNVYGFELCNLAKNFLYTYFKNFFGNDVTLGIQTSTIDLMHFDKKIILSTTHILQHFIETMCNPL